MAPDISPTPTILCHLDHCHNCVSAVNRRRRTSPGTLDLHDHRWHSYYNSCSPFNNASAHIPAPSLRSTYRARPRYSSDAILACVHCRTSFVSGRILRLWEAIKGGGCCIRAVREVQKCVAERSGSSRVFCYRIVSSSLDYKLQLLRKFSFLFLFTTLVFIYYYHCHLAGENAYGISGRRARTNDTDNTYGVAHPISGPAVRNGATEEHQLRSNPSHSHTGLNGHSPTAATQSSAHGHASSSQPRTVNQDDEIGSDMPASPKPYGSGPTNEPVSPISASQFPQPPTSSTPATASSGANLPASGAPSSPPRSPTSPTRPGRPDEYGVEHGSNVGPGADTTRP